MSTDKMITNPSECEELDRYESAIKEVTGNNDLKERAKGSRLNDLLYVYRQRGCKAACGVRNGCERMLAGNLTPEMIERVPAARFLSKSAD